MEDFTNYMLTDNEKEIFINALTSNLALLRAKANISQEEISNFIGVSRQTYGSIERKTRKMSWGTYLSLILFYDYNVKTHDMVRNIEAFPHEIIKRVNNGDVPMELDIESVFKPNVKNIIDALDDQAISTIRKIMMIEYSRCTDMPSDAIIKLFEGLDFCESNITEKDKKTARALKNIKK